MFAGTPGMMRRRIWRDRRGVSAIETGLLMTPFVTLLLGIISTGIYFTNQSSLDSGVLVTAETQGAAMLASSTYTLPSTSALKAAIASGGGSLLSASNMAVDVRLLTNLTNSAVPISDGTEDITSCVSGDILVLRAQSSVNWLVPGFTTLSIASSAIMRCPNTL
jgi:Flp pilus assembly protein TadG